MIPISRQVRQTALLAMRRKESSASRYGSGSSSLHYDLLEKDNDNHLSHLRTQARQHKTAVARVKSLLQVASLKSLSLDIEAEVKSQNEFLGEMVCRLPFVLGETPNNAGLIVRWSRRTLAIDDGKARCHAEVRRQSTHVVSRRFHCLYLPADMVSHEILTSAVHLVLAHMQSVLHISFIILS